MGYITKCNSGTVGVLCTNNGESIVQLRFRYTQMYDARHNKSQFIINKFYSKLYGDRDAGVISLRSAAFDGKIKINGELVYTASIKNQDAVASFEDKDRESVTNMEHLCPFRCGSNDNYEIISPVVEVEHDDARSGKVKIEFTGNSSSNFFVRMYMNSSTYKDWKISSKSLEGAYVEQDNGCNYKITYDSLAGTDDENIPQEYFLFGSDYSDIYYFKQNYIRLSGTTIQQINSSSDTIAGERCNIGVATKAKHYYKMNLSLGEWEQSYEFTEDSATFENGIPISYCGIIPLDVLNYMPNSMREKATAVLWTYLDAEYTNPVGDSEPSYFYVSVPSDAIPQIESFGAVVKFTDSDYNLGEAISGYSYIVLSANAEGIYGSTIKKYIISGAYNEELDGSRLEYTGKVINTNGIKEFNIVAVDSRGMRSLPKQYFIQFYKYEKPRIALFDVKRDPGDDTTITVRPAWEIASVNNKNSSTGTVKFKKKNEIAWRTLCEVQNNPSDPIQVSNPDEEHGDWDKYTSYEFMLVVQDSTKNYCEQIKLISTIKVILDFKNPETRESYGGVGIGKTCELENYAEIWLNAKFYNDVYIGDDTLYRYIANIMNAIKVQKNDIVVLNDMFMEYYPVLSPDYPYRAAIPIDGVDSGMIPEVVFSQADVSSGIFGSVAESYDGGIYIYASEKPSSEVTIPTIICWRGAL